MKNSNNKCNSSNECSKKKKLDKKLDLIHQDIKKIIEDSNRKYLDGLAINIKKENLEAIKEYLNKENNELIEKNINLNCKLHEKCGEYFHSYFENSIKEIDPDNLSKDSLNEYLENLNSAKMNNEKYNCEPCFNNFSDSFEKQFKLLSSLSIYESDYEDDNDLPELKPDILVENILDSVSNKHRLSILKSIEIEPKTFSDLSKLTNLRGGNLLFHIEKLENNDFIFQKNERGEYLLTKKGFKTILLLKNLQKEISDDSLNS
ncbi:winged helix-turn-helix domain-containing protein [Methanobrevibacter sp. DSM 116169]|uniref:winged helix-turn-helix domain-containing protein n=1 Tax=Methanobrevibacter sp. DSM 116169 TaxID=3242727 RepID=UPI0038FD3D4F